MKQVWQSLCRAITGMPPGPVSKTLVGQTATQTSQLTQRSVETTSITTPPPVRGR
jgi:hypothetical protein